MRLVPKTLTGKIGFYAARLPKWAQDPAAIGATPEQIAALQDKLEVAKAALLRQQQARNAARAATLGLHLAVGSLARAGANVILQVRAKAGSGGAAVYSAASISPRKNPSPIAAPGKPSGFEVELSAIGLLTLRWKCRNPAGSVSTLYHLWRRIDAPAVRATGQFDYLGATGTKRFVDATVPAGASSLTYQVRAARSKKAGPTAQFTVSFGTTGGSAMIRASLAAQKQITAPPSKIAA